MPYQTSFAENLILLIVTTFIIVVTCMNIGYYRGILYNENGPNNGVSIRVAQAAIGLNGFLLALALFYFLYKIYLMVTSRHRGDNRTVNYELNKIFNPEKVNTDDYFSTASWKKYVNDDKFKEYIDADIRKINPNADFSKLEADRNAARMSQNPKGFKLPFAKGNSTSVTGTTPGLLAASQ